VHHELLLREKGLIRMPVAQTSKSPRHDVLSETEVAGKRGTGTGSYEEE
jgi:hypothetical protein